MRLATIVTPSGTAAVRIDGDSAVETGHRDVGALLGERNWRDVAERADGPRHPSGSLRFAPVVPRPDKIVCVGLNYRSHIAETGRQLPEFPTLFAKFSSALIGANDDIVVPKATSALDWEAELGVVIGSPVRHASPAEAAKAIAGFTVVNDVTARDWQHRTMQWLQGKTFEATTPVGPWLVVGDDAAATFTISCDVDGQRMQHGHTSDLLFDPVHLVSYISTVVTLLPGDLIATGTPGGVGHARTPPVHLAAGSTVVTTIDGIGTCTNRCIAET